MAGYDLPRSIREAHERCAEMLVEPLNEVVMIAVDAVA